MNGTSLNLRWYISLGQALELIRIWWPRLFLMGQALELIRFWWHWHYFQNHGRTTICKKITNIVSWALHVYITETVTLNPEKGCLFVASWTKRFHIVLSLIPNAFSGQQNLSIRGIGVLVHHHKKPSILQRVTVFVTSYFLSWTANSFRMGSTLKIILFLRVDPHWEGRQKWKR